jgi:hypothetical protein
MSIATIQNNSLPSFKKLSFKQNNTGSSGSHISIHAKASKFSSQSNSKEIDCAVPSILTKYISLSPGTYIDQIEGTEIDWSVFKEIESTNDSYIMTPSFSSSSMSYRHCDNSNNNITLPDNRRERIKTQFVYKKKSDLHTIVEEKVINNTIL